MNTVREIEENMEQIRTLCNKYNVKTLFAFGSVIKGNLKPDSDIDMLVDIAISDPISYSESYFELKFSLQKIFQRPVDLIEQRALKNQLFSKHLDNTKVLLYGG